MKIAIHEASTGFSGDWISYCRRQAIDYKIVDCFRSDIVAHVADCDVLLWHFHHTSAKDFLFARQLLYSLQNAGKIVFPDFNTAWHFDDKVAQKYLLEAINAPLVPSYTFYHKATALQWIKHTAFPKVFKLRGGAGSNNVKLVNNKKEANQLIRRAFGRGFPNYDRWNDLNENWRRWRMNISNFLAVAKSIRRLFVGTTFGYVKGPERGYVYFQDFMADNTFDIRVVTIGKRAFAIKRLVREHDFRASGSGFIVYDKKEIDERCVEIAFETSAKLNSQVVAYDFVFDKDQPKIVEINYGYAHKSYFACPGYWSQDMQWHEGSFNSAEWIIELVVEQIR